MFLIVRDKEKYDGENEGRAVAGLVKKVFFSNMDRKLFKVDYMVSDWLSANIFKARY